MIIVILFLVFLGIAAPIQMAANRRKLKEMDRLIDEYEATRFSTDDERETAKRILKKNLIALKAKILADKRSTQLASDKILIV